MVLFAIIFAFMGFNCGGGGGGGNGGGGITYTGIILPRLL